MSSSYASAENTDEYMYKKALPQKARGHKRINNTISYVIITVC